MRPYPPVETIAGLVPLLFGYGDAGEIELLRSAMTGLPECDDPNWLQKVRKGHFEAIPDDLRWGSSVKLAHLVEGYALAETLGLGDPFEFEGKQLARAIERGSWLGGPAVLWATPFLEHRRWRMASLEPGPEVECLLDRLCQQLFQSLNPPPEPDA